MVLDADGLTITQGGARPNAISWDYSGTIKATLTAYDSTGAYIKLQSSETATGVASRTIVEAQNATDGYSAYTNWQASSSSNITDYVQGGARFSVAQTAVISHQNLIALLGLYVGSAGTPDADQIYADGDVSALTFTDRTPHYSGDALAEIRGVRGNGKGRLDHASLPGFARKVIHVKRDGADVFEEGRDLGAMVSILTTAVQQLLERIEAMEGA